MKRNQKILFIESLSWWHLIIIIPCHIFKFKVYVFDTFTNLSKSYLFRLLDDRNIVNRVYPHQYALSKNHSRAINITNSYFQKPKLPRSIRLIIELFDDYEAKLIFKRILAQDLSILISMEYYINKISNEIGAKNPIFLVGGSSQYFSLIKKVPGNEFFLKNVSVKKVFYPRISFKLLITVLIYIAHLLINTFLPKNQKIEYAQCVAYNASYWAKFNNNRKFSFLVDEKFIKSKDTLFLFEYKINKDFIKKENQYRIDSLTRGAKGILVSLCSSSNLKLRTEFRNILLLIFSVFSRNFITEAIYCAITERLTYSVLLQKYKFNNYIYNNKEGPRQISANIFFRKNQVKTWSYNQFIGGQHQLEGPQASFDDLNTYWTYINPDEMILANESILDSNKKHFQSVKNYRVIGNIFKFKFSKNDIRQSKTKLLSMKNSNNLANDLNKKWIGIFDSSYADISDLFFSYDEAIGFLNDISRLAIENPEKIFIFKPAKNTEVLLNKFEGWYSSKYSKTVFQLRKDLEKMDNIIFLRDDFDPSEVISISNLVITNNFSSPTVDALANGYPAFWHDATGRTKDFPLDRINGAVTHGFGELKKRFEEIIINNEVDKVFKDPLFDYYIEPKLDKKNLEEFRRLISLG